MSSQKTNQKLEPKKSKPEKTKKTVKKEIKPYKKEVKIGMFGCVAGMHFDKNRAFLSVLADPPEIKRILKSIQTFVHEEFPKDEDYLKAVDLVVKKFERKHHSLRIVEDVILGTKCISFDHWSGKEMPWNEDE